jgi:succinate dehydrogenase flavin-adding protein (antitoxin of CptAB toxin-antitoxin module)
MKELDLMLESFMAMNHEALFSGGHPQLEQFLAQEDDQIWAWLQMIDRPENSGFRKLVDAIRSAS